MKRLLIGVFLSLIYVTIGNAAITKIYGISIDNTQPAIAPCMTFGFSIDATNTLPTGQNVARMVRVDRTVGGTNGYVLTSQATGYTVYVFNIQTMEVIGSTTNTITGYQNQGRLQGDVGTDGKLYVFNLVSSVNPSCPGGVASCLMMSRWSSTSLENAVIDTVNRTDNVDDARESGSNFLTIVTGVTGLREFRTYSKSGLAHISTGTVTGVSAFGHIGRTMDGRMFGALGITSNPNMWTFPIDSPTSDGSGQLVFLNNNLIGAIAPILKSDNTQLYSFDSDITGGGLTGQRLWVTPPIATVVGGPSLSGGVGVFASFQGAFFDTLNNKSFLLRTSGGNGLAERTTPGIIPFTSEELFVCGAQCNNAGGSSTGTQIVDYSERYARMYVGSNESPARLTRIKVCATGGP